MEETKNQMGTQINATTNNIPTSSTENKPTGPAFGIIIIILIIILGGFYYWSKGSQNQTVEQSSNQGVENAPLQTSNDDLSSIESDLNNTSVNSLGSEINSIENEALNSDLGQ